MSPDGGIQANKSNQNEKKKKLPGAKTKSKSKANCDVEGKSEISGKEMSAHKASTSLTPSL